MAIRVQTQDNITFGPITAAVTVTHIRVQKAGSAPVVKQLTASISVASGDSVEIASGSLDFVYPVGDMTNTHFQAFLDPYWDGEDFQVDLMTSSSAVVTAAGYAQQTYSNWAISAEAD